MSATGNGLPNSVRPRRRIWQSVAVIIALTMTAPLLVAVASLAAPAGDVWAHLSRFVLPRVIPNTIGLTVAVGLLALIVGGTVAWLCAVCEFPGRRHFSWSLMLPLAMPGYVIAFALAGVFGYAGPISSGLRDTFGWPLPDFNAATASAVCLTLTLYPYVFLLARQAFASQGVRALEVAESCGLSRWQGFLRVSLPMARPWLAAGTALVAMETLADFGTVKVFNFDTFTTAIYSAWFSLFSLTAALQMSVMLLLLVMLALWLERRSRGSRRYTVESTRRTVGRIELRGWRAAAATAFCSALLLIAFIIPLVQLLVWGWQTANAEWSLRYLDYLRASLVLAAMAAVLISALSLLLGFSERQSPGTATRWSARLSTLGYALPGTVLAVGFFVFIAGLQSAMTDLARLLGASAQFQITLTGTLLVMLLAYAARFMAVAHGPLGSAFERITPRIDDAAQGLGVYGRRLLGRVYLPILAPGIATAALLVFVDVMKELPITLITRPFGWDTLAVRIFQMTTEGEWQRASIPALAIVAAGLIPVLWLHARSAAQEHKHSC